VATTSGTYNFSSSATVENVINEAYERIGITPNLTPGYSLESAQRSLNFLLTSWTNNSKGLKLWTVQKYILSLKPGQASYAMPPFTITTLEVQLRQSNRNLGGTPFAKVAGVNNGIAANAFDGNPNTACTQTLPNGDIGYSWATSTYAIQMVGVQSNVTRTYTLVFEYSVDGTTWTQVGAPAAQEFPVGTNIWFAINSAQMGTAFRIRETAGATLDIQELYFNTQLQDTVMSAFSRSEYEAQPNKNQTGRPSSYYLDRQIEPVLNIWPAPINTYNAIAFTATSYIQDIGALLNLPQVPSRYYEPLVTGLAFLLGLKNPKLVDINRLQYLKALYDEAFKIASDEDRERVPLRIYGSYISGWSQS
jgi:hypothetical protein